MKIKISNAKVQELLTEEQAAYHKYATQLINLANQNAQGTRPKIVGKMSELIREFDGMTLREWEHWYLQRHPDAVRQATEKIWTMINALKDSIQQITHEMVEQWVKDLVIVKTFTGLKFQQAILIKVAELLGKDLQLATSEEESRGIDGYIGSAAVSVKPVSYSGKKGLNESIGASIIFYNKDKSGISVEFDPESFSG